MRLRSYLFPSLVRALVVCECGNEVVISAEQTSMGYRCPRCGRRVFASEDDARAYFDSHSVDGDQVNDDPHPPGSVNHNAQSQNTADFSPAIQRNTEQNAAPDFDATVLQSVPPPVHNSEKKEADGVAMPTMGVNVSTLPINNDDFELKSQPEDDDSSVGAGSSLSTPKYDLSQRVMRPITKPVLPVVPYTGAGEYGIHRILRVHQRGGMGRILVAYDQYLKRDVAIKELHPDVAEDESIVRRFIGEAEITAQLEHPGVVPIHRLGQGRDGLPYYTMKMIKGDTLQEAIKAYHRKPSKTELLNLVRRIVSVAKTMAFAHSKGVIHRDLKPANVMLGEHGETLVMDWGLAKPVHQGIEESFVSVIHRTKQTRPELTMVGAIVGTPAFMSPEQARAEENMVGPLSDVFSLGTILYYLLAGQTAFSGRSTQEVLNKVRAAIVTPPSQIKSNVPHDLEMICLKAMARLPEDRYQGAAEFAADLCRWLDDEPVAAEKDSVVNKIRRWITHHQLVVVGVLCILFLPPVLMSVASRSRNTASVVVSSPDDLSEFKHVRMGESPGVRVWMEPRHSGELLLTCQVEAIDSEKHHIVPIHATDKPWDLASWQSLTFSLLEISSGNNSSLKNFSIRLGQGESYYEYKPNKEIWENRNIGGWSPFKIPLKGGHDDWKRVHVGTPAMSKIEWIEVHFDTDSDITLNFDNIKFRRE